MMTASTVGEKDAVGIDEANVTFRHVVTSERIIRNLSAT
jgi:hypothetical protein